MKKILLSFVFIILVCGCNRYVYVSPEYPIIHTPDRPSLTVQTLDDIKAHPEIAAENIKKLIIYSACLEENIKLYNTNYPIKYNKPVE